MFDKHRHGPTPSILFIRVTLLVLCMCAWHHLFGSVENSRVPPAFNVIEHQNDSLFSLLSKVNELPSSDLSKLINMQDFKFLINNFPCNQSSSPFLLFLVHSAPDNVMKRNVIRQTWGKKRDLIKLIFFIGDVVDKNAQNQLNIENISHKDIVQGNFIDNYRNMTYKHVMVLKWAIYFCSGAKYILKSDDDIFVNTPELLKFLATIISPFGAKKLIFCCPFSKRPVLRSWRSKWRVSPVEYAASRYPTYCPGWAIIYSMDVIFELYREAQISHYFWIDDVHITGTLAARINVTHTSFSYLVLTNEDVMKYLKSSAPLDTYLFGPPNLPLRTIELLWNLVDDAAPTVIQT